LKNLLGHLGTVEAGRAPELPPEWLLEHLFTLAVAQREYAALAGGLIAALQPDAPRHFSFNLLAALLEALEAKGISFQEFQRRSQRELKTLASRKEAAVAEARRIVPDEQAELPLRLAAVRLLGRGERPQDDLVQLAKLLEPQQPQPLQQASLAVIRRHRAPQLAAHLVGRWEQYSPAARLEVLDALFARTEWLRMLLKALERQEIEPQEIPASYRQRLLSHKEENVRWSAGQLFSVVASDRQEVIERYAGLSLLPGDRINGGRLYQQLCAQCHRTEEIGTAIGPDLVSMHDKSIDFLLVEILDPNRSVDPKYVSYNIRTAGGAELSGIITSESANSLTILTAAGAEETLLRSDIASLSSSRLSLMPEGLEESLPPQAMADLIAYLRNGSAQ
jgi:putative heme-binding domain-containing protein